MNHQHRHYRTFIWIGLIASLFILSQQLIWLARQPTTASSTDFMEYWAAGRLNIQGDNPYSASDLQIIQQQSEPIIMWNPPWVLTLVMPFALPDYPVGRLLWLVLNISVVFISVDYAWHYYGGLLRQRWVAWLLAFGFVPTFVMLGSGQITPIILFGVVSFLYFVKERRWWLAGAATILISVKPHLLYLFWLALVLWIISERRWRVLLGGILTLVAMLTIALISNPAVVSQYLNASINQPPLYWTTPTLGALLRHLLGWSRSWLQFVPIVLGSIWLLVSGFRRRTRWDWGYEMPRLLLVSMVFSSYGWSVDQVVLLLPIIWCAVGLLNGGTRQARYIAVLFFLVVNGIFFYLRLQQATEFLYLWLAPTLLLGYLGVRRQLAASERLS